MALDILSGLKKAFTDWGSQLATGAASMPFAPGIGASAYQILPPTNSTKTADIFKSLTDQDAIGDIPRVPVELLAPDPLAPVNDMPPGLQRHLIQQ